MDTVFYLLFTLSYSTLIAWGLKGIHRNHLTTWSSLIYIVTIGLIYDNAVMGLGKWIGEGNFLEFLNAIRFWSHAFLTPLLVLYSVGVLRESGIKWANKTWISLISILYTLFIIILEIQLETSKLTLIPKKEYGVLRYVSSESDGGPPIMVLLVTFVLLVASFIVWKKTKWPWFFIGTAVMTIGSMVPIDVNSSAVTNGFELILIWTLIWTKKQLVKDELKI